MVPPLRTFLCQQPGTDWNNCSERKGLVMRQLQLIAFGEPSEVIELHTVPEPVLGQEDVLVSMEAAPLNPSDFLLVRGSYGVRPALPFSLGAEGVGRPTRARRLRLLCKGSEP